MSFLRTRNLRRDNHTWPGFVDALATLLMVVIFVLMIFSLAQFYLNQLVSGKDEALITLNNKLLQNENELELLNKKIIEISEMLLLEKEESKNLNNEIIVLKNTVSDDNKEIDNLNQMIKLFKEEILGIQKTNAQLEDSLKIAQEENINIQASNKKIVKDLNEQILADKEMISLKLNDILELKKIKDKLNAEISNLLTNNKEINSKFLKERDYNKSLEERLNEFEDKTALVQKEINFKSSEILAQKNLINNLSNTLAQVKLKLSQLQALFDKQKQQNEAENIAVESIGNNLNTALVDRVKELQRFRSEFFGRLSNLLQGRDEIQIVGDRFVFQSEVLFEPASAKIGLDGRVQIKKLSASLKEISDEIPDDINWVLQVEGHTDKTPLKPGVYRDNWDLSTERALSVVRLLIQNGIEPKRLSASGYGEFHPFIDESDYNSNNLRKNRRIELKLTQRIE